MARLPPTGSQSFDNPGYPPAPRVPDQPIPVRPQGGGMTGLAIFLVLVLIGVLLAIFQHRSPFSEPAPTPSPAAPLPPIEDQGAPPTS